MRSKVVFALCLWVFVYPLVTSLLLALRGTGLNLSLPIQTLVVSIVLVPTIVFLVGPLVSRLTRKFSISVNGAASVTASVTGTPGIADAGDRDLAASGEVARVDGRGIA